jgi:A/G-specific adenine glycosylase
LTPPDLKLAEPRNAPGIRRKLQRWYEGARRKLPWRQTQDPYRIWVSEIMLQQTRVAAVIPYYQRFLERFPDIFSLAAAPEQDLLATWSGLGYYSRARNLQKAARQMNGEFPMDYANIRELPGVGDYTAAAVASIAFGLPHAVLDGNVLRVLSRLTNDAGDIGTPVTRKRLQVVADGLLDRKEPGNFNQSLMELGATVCLPRDPQCHMCPLTQYCEARRSGTAAQLPVKKRGPASIKRVRTLLIICKNNRWLFWQRRQDAKMLAGMWELPEPEQLPGASMGECLGEFRHSITVHDYTFRVFGASLARKPVNFRWIGADEISGLPLSTTARKGLAVFSSRL